MLALFLKVVGLLSDTVRRTPKSMIPSFSAEHIFYFTLTQRRRRSRRILYECCCVTREETEKKEGVRVTLERVGFGFRFQGWFVSRWRCPSRAHQLLLRQCYWPM